jgi:hypothetical protein
MITKELIHSEINNVNEEDLDDLYEVIKHFSQTKRNVKKPGLMSKLRHIHIDAPEDFATNLDLYVSGEKHVESNLC